MHKVGDAAEELWAGVALIQRVFGVFPKSLSDNGCVSRRVGKRLEYEIADVWKNCRHLIYKRLQEELSSGSSYDDGDMKYEKLREEVRKLRILNDQAEGLLVSAVDVEATFSRAIKAMGDELDSIPSRVKMAVPDIDQSALAAILDCLTASRRKASRLDYSDDGLDNGG